MRASMTSTQADTFLEPMHVDRHTLLERISPSTEAAEAVGYREGRHEDCLRGMANPMAVQRCNLQQSPVIAPLPGQCRAL